MSTLVTDLVVLPPTAVHEALAAPSTSTSTPSSPTPSTGTAGRLVQFTFDMNAGALRRDLCDVLADRMSQTGLDVSWVDNRSGVLGKRRRFTVRGPRPLVQRLIAEIGSDLGWQPGAVALPR
jgi:hypothetical protein